MAGRPRSFDRDEAAARHLERVERGRSAGLDARTAREAVERLLRTTAEVHTARPRPRGCLVMSEPLPVGERLRDRDIIRDRVLRGRDRSEMPTDTDVEPLTDVVVLAAMSARVRDGATRTRLDATVDRGTASWPTPPDR